MPSFSLLAFGSLFIALPPLARQSTDVACRSDATAAACRYGRFSSASAPTYMPRLLVCRHRRAREVDAIARRGG